MRRLDQYVRRLGGMVILGERVETVWLLYYIALMMEPGKTVLLLVVLIKTMLGLLNQLGLPLLLFGLGLGRLQPKRLVSDLSENERLPTGCQR